MFKYIPLREQIIGERKKNAQLQTQVLKQSSDIDYIAMMTDIDLDTDETEETFDEQ